MKYLPDLYKVHGRNAEAYGYTYDYLDRLTTARQISTNPSGARTINGYNDEIGYADARGNISIIYRAAMVYTSATAATQGVIDNLSFSYLSNTNKLSAVTEATTDIALKAKGFNPGEGVVGYEYACPNQMIMTIGNASACPTTKFSIDEERGNLISDSYKGISSIIYNHFNLPGSVNFSSRAKIVFTYAANACLPNGQGKKLRKQVYATNGTTINTTIDYVDGIEYLNRKVEAIYNPEGRAYNTSTTATPIWRYEYNIKDLPIAIKMGNNRVSFSDIDGNGSISNAEVLQEQHYYPRLNFSILILEVGQAFGMAQEGTWMNNSSGDDSRYTYNGKEFNGDNGLNWLDYGGRWYDGSIVRFTTKDRFTEKYYNLTPFQYAGNNPISNIDFKGDSIIKVTIIDNSGYIDDTKSILEYAATNELPIHLNSSFRTNKKQGGLTSANSTTPVAKSKSAHNAGLALDFNLYKNDKTSDGADAGNSMVTKDHKLIKEVKGKSWRWGGDFTTPDKIHMDKKGTGSNFETIRDVNQTQMDGDNKEDVDESLIKRTETITINKKNE